MHSKITIAVEKPFILDSTLQSHGWVDLLPNFYIKEERSFSRTQRLSSGIVVQLKISSSGDLCPDIFIKIEHPKKLSLIEQREIRDCIQHMLRLDEDLQEFHDFSMKKEAPWKSFQLGTGYLLRSPDIFEELVKVILTTNIQWGGTKRMVRELVEKFGDPYSKNPTLIAFPTPKSILAVSLHDFKNSLRLGYRADYIYKLAAQIANGSLISSELLDKNLSTQAIKKRLLSIKGVGNYAATTMLMLLGRYDQIPIDTVFRDFMKAKYFQGKPFTEEESILLYEEWGKWKYLAYWYEMIDFYHSREAQ